MGDEKEIPVEITESATSLEKQVTRPRSDSCEDIRGFYKSKKTSRAPVRKKKEREEQNDTRLILEAMKSMEKNLQVQLKKDNDEIKAKMEENNIEMRKVIEEVKNEVMLIKEKEIQWEADKKDILEKIKIREEENNVQKELIKSLEERIKSLETQQPQQEKYSNSSDNKKQDERLLVLERNLEREQKEKRKNNIIIKGTKFANQNLREEVKQFLNDKLNVEAEISFVKLIKTGQKENILAKIETQQQKKEIMKAKAKLKNEKEMIFIENDLTFEERKVQRQIIIQAKQQKEEGKEIKIGYHKLKIGNAWHKWDYKTASLKKMAENESKN